jgi:PAS domain-containing protein
MKAYMLDGRPRITKDTVDLEGEYVSENYYQMKNGSMHTLFTSPEMNSNDYIAQGESSLCVSVATRMMLHDVFIGMVEAEMSLANIDKKLDEMPLDYAGKPFVIASNGKIYCHSNPDLDRTNFLDAYSGIDHDDEVAHAISESLVCSTDYEDRDGIRSHLTLLPIAVKDSGRPWTLVSEIYYARIFKQTIRKVMPYFLLSFLGLALMVIFTLSFIRKSTNPMQQASIMLNHIDRGEYDKVEHLESSDEEINTFYKSLNIFAEKIQRTTEFARSIGSGDLNIKYEIDSQNALDAALIDMQKNLQHAREEEENRKVENEKLSWSQNGLAQLGEYLRMSNIDISEFAFNVISFLVKYVGALQGGIFISEEQDNTKYLSLKAAYAFDRKKQLEGRVEFGESLVGRCAIEGKTIFLTDIPDGYLYITSGLGENKPRCLLLVPLVFEDEVHGVIEIASIKMIEEYQITFFNSVAERIASSISNIKKNINTAELLEKFRTQSDELAFRESEIQKSLAGIKESRTEIGKLQYETEAILDALAETCIVTRYDTTAVVQDLRDKTLDVTGYKRSDILGHNLREILALTKNDMDNFDKFWEDIIKGKRKSRKFTRGEQLYRETFTLINDSNGMPYKVISVAIPV